MASINSIVAWTVEQGVGLLTVDSPPVNALSQPVCQGIHRGLELAMSDPGVSAVVLICGGRTFFAGADISEFGKRLSGPTLTDVQRRMEALTKPVVAAIHGTALGGGLEIALAAHFRVAVPSAKVGLPEVTLGLLPGAGGTQRLPRIIGADAALEFIAFGAPIDAQRALELGILDAVVPENALRAAALAFAQQAAEQRSLPRIRDRQDRLVGSSPALFDEFRRRHARTFRGFRAPENIIRAVEAAVTLPFDAGLEREAALFAALVNSTESAAQRYAFFAERAAAKIPDIPADTRPLPVRTVGILGADANSGQMAVNILDAGLPATVFAQRQHVLDEGVQHIRGHYEVEVRQGRLTPQAMHQRMTLLTPTVALGALAHCDFVIDGGSERLDWKQEVLAHLERVLKPDAILATNTPLPDLDAVASAMSHSQRLIGARLHSPAKAKGTIEVVRASSTSPTVVATTLQFAKKTGRAAVLSHVPGAFVVDRMLASRALAADGLVRDGIPQADIDRVLDEFGFPSNVDGTQPAHTAEPSTELLERLLLPLVNEGVKLLEADGVLRASDIDIALIHGAGWPVYRGGPMFWADTVGLDRIVRTLDALRASHGELYAAASLLRRLATTGGRLHEQ